MFTMIIIIITTIIIIIKCYPHMWHMAQASHSRSVQLSFTEARQCRMELRAAVVVHGSCVRGIIYRHMNVCVCVWLLRSKAPLYAQYDFAEFAQMGGKTHTREISSIS